LIATIRDVAKRQSNWPTTTRQSRGYGVQWQRKRKVVLARDGYICRCSHCRADGSVRVATEVDHVVSRAAAAKLGWPAERTEGEANLQAINSDCHERKTMEETGHRPARHIGLDGFPIDV
jgi:5-methylcytosine-specific restriction protein A